VTLIYGSNAGADQRRRYFDRYRGDRMGHNLWSRFMEEVEQIDFVRSLLARPIEA
jgi:hypothetical protein